MKKALLILGAALLACLAWWLAGVENRSVETEEIHSAKGPPPDEIFEKGFWKRPTPQDQILHAERRETKDGSGTVTQWQWYLAVKPSESLVQHLITNNAFMLIHSSKPLPAKGLPKGFPTSAEGYEVFSSASGTFFLLWDKEKNLLHATDSGSGFRPGGPETIKSLVTSPSQGRLPQTPPPKP